MKGIGISSFLLDVGNGAMSVKLSSGVAARRNGVCWFLSVDWKSTAIFRPPLRGVAGLNNYMLHG
ncbi:hypothetical protein SBV1_3580002 [Verrucomicrobia bacterium]|nr:hypothetical protein SBV1_3580002 [Verrucomicrobiota bacterium]